MTRPGARMQRSPSHGAEAGWRRSHTIGIAALAAVASLALASPSSAQSRNCAPGLRALAGAAGMPKVPELVCPTGDDAGSSTLRVSFLRLDESLAGNLVLGEKVPE